MIIGLVGRAGSGKDTVGGMISRHLGNVHLLSFATPLKQFCRDVFDFSDEQLYGPSECRNAPDPRYPRADGTCLSPREALQTLGTEWGRACWPDVWATLGVRRAQGYHKAGHHAVFTDCRFINEAKAIRSMGGEVWRICRPSSDSVASTHPSELELSSPAMHSLLTGVIHNTDSLEWLLASVKGRIGAAGISR